MWGFLPRAVRLTYNPPHSSPQGGTIVARLVRAGSAPKLIRVPLGTAAFRNSLVSPPWASLHPQPRSRAFCSIERFVSRHDFGLGFDKACSRSLSTDGLTAGFPLLAPIRRRRVSALRTLQAPAQANCEVIPCCGTGPYTATRAIGLNTQYNYQLTTSKTGVPIVSIYILP